jgi:riboflavin kinase/FMN adenylyltransferase
MSDHKAINGVVIRGLGNGKSQAFATVNLDPQLWPTNFAKGVYAAWVLVAGKKYKGALFFGPRKVLQEEQDVLEIHLLDFREDIYEQEISFSIEKFIRGVEDFSSFEDLKNRIASDISAVEKSLSY